jgi:hypothetical protein
VRLSRNLFVTRVQLNPATAQRLGKKNFRCQPRRVSILLLEKVSGPDEQSLDSPRLFARLIHLQVLKWGEAICSTSVFAESIETEND